MESSNFRIGIAGQSDYQGKMIFNSNLGTITSNLNPNEVQLLLLTEMDNHPLIPLCQAYESDFTLFWLSDLNSFIQSGLDILLVFGRYDIPFDLELYCIENNIIIQKIDVSKALEDILSKKQTLAKEEFKKKMALDSVNLNHTTSSVSNDPSPIPTEVLNEIVKAYGEQLIQNPGADMTQAAMNIFDMMARRFESDYSTQVMPRKNE
jgi:hypothetical protein